MTKLRDQATAVRRYLLGEAGYSPRLENVAMRVLDQWAHTVEMGRKANAERMAVADKAAIRIHGLVEAEMDRDARTREVAYKRVVKLLARETPPTNLSVNAVRARDKKGRNLLKDRTPTP